MSASPLPEATYRLQFSSEFRFSDASALVDYLAKLGITDIYASPILTSRKGSKHGYDVTDPTQINPGHRDGRRIRNNCKTNSSNKECD